MHEVASEHMASFKKILLDYGLYIILVLNLLHSMRNINANEQNVYSAIALAVLSFGLIVAVIYIQWHIN